MNSDEDLQQTVNDDLNWDAAIDASHLAVTAKNGVVTIQGRVRHYSEKWEAERLTETIAGVKAVVIHVEVVPVDIRSDAQIAGSDQGPG